MVRGRKPLSQSWKTFLRSHAHATAAIDLCIAPTMTFERLFAFLILGHERRRQPWIELTRHPKAEWLARHITEAFRWVTALRYLIRDNDGCHIIVLDVFAYTTTNWPIMPASSCSRLWQ